MALEILKSPFIQNIGGTPKQVNFETSADQVKMLDKDGGQSTAQQEIEILRLKTEGLLSSADALVFKGVLDGSHALPAADYEVGWTYRVNEAGTYAGQPCEVGDLVICVADYADSAKDSDWTAAQTNLDGVVIGPTSAVSGNVPVFDSATGKVVADSGLSAADLGKKWATAVAAMPEGEDLTTLMGTLHDGAIIVVDPSVSA